MVGARPSAFQAPLEHLQEIPPILQQRREGLLLPFPGEKGGGTQLRAGRGFELRPFGSRDTVFSPEPKAVCAVWGRLCSARSQRLTQLPQATR